MTSTSAARRLRCLAIAFAALALLFAVSVARAQPLPDGAGNDGTAETATGTDPRLRTVADALDTFFGSFPDDVETDGIAAIDFSGSLALLSNSQRVEAANQLKSVIDRVRWVDVDKIREAVPDGRSRYTLEDIPGAGRIELKRSADGEWRFTPETIQALPALWDRVEGRKVVEGVEHQVALGPAQWIRGHMPAGLKRQSVLLEGWQWLGILVLITLGVVFDRLAVLLLTVISGVAMRGFKLTIQKESRRSALRPFGMIAMAGTWAAGIGLLMLPAGMEAVLGFAAKFLAAASFVLAAYKAVGAVQEVFLRRAEQTASRMDDLIVPFVGRIAKIFVAAFGIVFVASNIGVDVSGLLAGLGLGGLAFALAAKDTVSNIFGSLTVLIDRPFNVGDWVTLENGVDGTVETVGLRSTRIRTFKNSLVTVPNSLLITACVDNYGERRYRRWSTTLSLTYDTPPEKIEAFCEGARELVLLHPCTRKDSFHIYANDFGDSSLQIMFYIFFETPDWGTELRERHRMMLDIIRLAHSVGVEFAFPTQTLHMVRDMPDHSNAPKNAAEARESGRSGARAILQKQYGERIPKQAPVSSKAAAADSTEMGGDGGEG